MRPSALSLLATLLVVPGCAADPEETSATTPSPSRTSVAAAVYYVGDTGRAGPRLYREFRRLSGRDLLTVAVNAALGAGDQGSQLVPLDPDYRTLWPALTLAEARFHESGVVQVDLGGDPQSDLRERARGMTSHEAELAVQQVVYTAQAAVQDRVPVRFLIRGEPTDRVLGVPTRRLVPQGAPLQVLSHVNLSAPPQGATLSGGELEVAGVGNSFEATLRWEIRRGDRVVRDGFATLAGRMADRLVPFETTVDVSSLEPGPYSVWVTTHDPAGGTEGVGAMADGKDFTIR